MIYAQFLGLRKRYPEALAQLEQAKSDARDSPFTQYNIGLVYLELGEHELALAQAWKAAGMGFPRKDLKQALQQAGKWREPPP